MNVIDVRTDRICKDARIRACEIVGKRMHLKVGRYTDTGTIVHVFTAVTAGIHHFIADNIGKPRRDTL